MDWCLAYGSLMDPSDAKRTLGATEQGLPVTLQGWRRDWNVASSRRYICRLCKGSTPGQPVALDLVEDQASELAAVLLPITQEQMFWLDTREDAYLRNRFKPKNLHLLAPGTVPLGRFWVYQAKPENRIEDTNRSDVFLPGIYQDLVYKAALAQGEHFANAASADIKAQSWPRREHLNFLHDPHKDIAECHCKASRLNASPSPRT